MTARTASRSYGAGGGSCPVVAEAGHTAPPGRPTTAGIYAHQVIQLPHSPPADRPERARLIRRSGRTRPRRFPRALRKLRIGAHNRPRSRIALVLPRSFGRVLLRFAVRTQARVRRDSRASHGRGMVLRHAKAV